MINRETIEAYEAFLRLFLEDMKRAYPIALRSSKKFSDLSDLQKASYASLSMTCHLYKVNKILKE
jgi:hypothetical protein